MAPHHSGTAAYRGVSFARPRRVWLAAAMVLRASGVAGNRLFHIAAYPRVTRLGNPYFDACHAALAKHGVTVSDELEVDPHWLEVRAGSVDAVHLHWPETFWRREPFGRLSRLGRGLRASHRLVQLRRFMRTARRLGMQRLWTLHNVSPHEGAYCWDRYGYRLLARECDLIVCHSDSAVATVRRLFRPTARTIVMPIGELGHNHPTPRRRDRVLGELHLDPAVPVVSCLGRLRYYKGLDLACAAVERLNGDVQLIVGGPRHAGFDVTPLREAMARTRAIAVLDRRLTDQEFADVLAASDAVLLPYRAITGSSALLTALGFGRGVVVSDLPYFREILSPEHEAGAIVTGEDATAWADAIREFLSRPADARNRAALRLAARYSWDRCVEPLVAAIRAHDRAHGVEAAPVGV